MKWSNLVNYGIKNRTSNEYLVTNQPIVVIFRAHKILN